MSRCVTRQLILGALVVGLGSLPAHGRTRQVVLLYDERTTLPGLAALDASIGRTLSSNSTEPVEVYRESMDLSRFGSDRYLLLLQDYLRAKYAGKKIDVVVAVMGPALDFLLSHGSAVFPETPIVFCGIDRRELGGRALPSRVTGVLIKRTFAPTMDVALKLHPGTRRVVFVAGTSDFDSRLLEQAREELRVYKDRVNLTYLTALPMRDLLMQLSGLPPNTVVLYSSLFKDGEGTPFVPHDVVERLAAASNAPVYGFVDQYLGRGIVGGRMYTLNAHGEAAASLVLKVLAGIPPSNIPVGEPEAGVTEFDWRQLQRWGISEDQLPEGSTVLFRQLSFWGQYKLYVSGVAAIITLQAVIIGGLLLQRKRRRRAEDALASLSGRLIEAQEEERRRIAREIHDDYNQRLAMLAIDLERLAEDIGDSPGEARQRLQQLFNDASELGADLHSLSHSLHSSTLGALGLVAGVKAFCEEFAQQQEVQVDFAHENVPPGIPGDAALCIFRIAQEGLRNVRRHSGADRAEVRLEWLGEKLHLSVSDRGRGFDSNMPPADGGIGLQSMQERLRVLGGELEVHSRPMEGARIDAWLPFKPLSITDA